MSNDNHLFESPSSPTSPQHLMPGVEVRSSNVPTNSLRRPGTFSGSATAVSRASTGAQSQSILRRSNPQDVNQLANSNAIGRKESHFRNNGSHFDTPSTSEGASVADSLPGVQREGARPSHEKGPSPSGAFCHALQRDNDDLRALLDSKNARIAGLKRRISIQNGIIDDRTSAGLSLLASSVSSPIRDDEIREKFQKFWNGDFEDWCDVSSVKDLQDKDALKRTFMLSGLIRRQGADVSASRIDFDSYQAPFLLLKTALAHTLCRAFLDEPLFMLENQDARRTLNSLGVAFQATNYQNAALWQAETIKLLAETFPAAENCADRAEDFTVSFQCLLSDDTNQSELLSLFTEFSQLALTLRKLSFPIMVKGLPELSQADTGCLLYDPYSRWMELDPALGKEPTRDTSSRPVLALTRPLIVSLRPSKSGESREVVWSPAYVWL